MTLAAARPLAADPMKRALRIRPGLGMALHVVQEGGRPLWRVFVEFPTLLTVRAGVKNLRCGKRELVVQTGEMIALAGGFSVDVTNTPPPDGPFLGQSLSIDPALCAEGALLGPRLSPIAEVRLIGRPPEFLSAAFARALTACDQTIGPPLMLARHQVKEVLLALAECGLRFDHAAANKVSTRVRQLVGSEVTRRWRAGAVARQLGMSEATLRRRLESEATTFRRVLQEVRMGRALVLLQSSELSVVQVAYEVGYDSVSQFSARFRRHFGQSPRQLRGAIAK